MLAVRASDPGRRQKIYSSPKSPNRFCSPPRLLFSGHQGPFPGVKKRGYDVDQKLLLDIKLGLRGSTSELASFVFMA
jgi:hypothetical protein